MRSATVNSSFRIDDILNKTSKHDSYKNESAQNSKPNTNDISKGGSSSCNNVFKMRTQSVYTEKSKVYDKHFEKNPFKLKHEAKTCNERTKTVIQNNQKFNNEISDRNEIKISENQNSNFRLPPLHPTYEERQYPTVPLMPTPIKPELPWSCNPMLKPTFPTLDSRSRFNFFSDSIPSGDQAMFLRNDLVARRYAVPYIMEPCNPYGIDRGYWASYLGYLPTLAKRKGGQVRFTTQQTNTLERRFAGNKYLSPEDRRLLAGQLKLSDRQVKTWFQNRRAKWRRTNNISDDKTDPEIEDISDDEEDLTVSKMHSVNTTPPGYKIREDS